MGSFLDYPHLLKESLEIKPENLANDIKILLTKELKGEFRGIADPKIIKDSDPRITEKVFLDLCKSTFDFEVRYSARVVELCSCYIGYNIPVGSKEELEEMVLNPREISYEDIEKGTGIKDVYGNYEDCEIERQGEIVNASSEVSAVENIRLKALPPINEELIKAINDSIVEKTGCSRSIGNKAVELLLNSVYALEEEEKDQSEMFNLEEIDNSVDQALKAALK